jgi:D-glycero-D-manno-heptose 1,7-bisphosphate phosphatase
MVKAVFFDKDGVLNKLVSRPTKMTSPWNLEELEFTWRSKEAVRMVQQYSWKTFMVTNQPDFGDGSAKPKDLKKILQMNKDYFGLDDYNFCITRDSDCYKPKTGMIKELANKHNIDISKSIMVGDTWRDMALAYNCGMKSYYIGDRESINLWPEEWRNVRPDYFTSNVYAACRHIVNGGVPQ